MIRFGSPFETLAFGRRLGASLDRGDAVLLQGDLGSGKTTLARGILQGLGHLEDVPSPTFSVMIPYRPPDTRLPIQHLDLYRLRGPDDLEELGVDDALAEGALIVEWPELVRDKPWAGRLLLTLEVDGEGRRLTAQAGRDWERRWPPQ